MCDHSVAGTVDKDGRFAERINIVGRIAGGMLNPLQVLHNHPTIEELIANHAYLFIKQGLGEIQRGITVSTSFNLLLSVIKRNTAARLQPHCLVPAFCLDQVDPFFGGST
jgi:hypothetical protein